MTEIYNVYSIKKKKQKQFFKTIFSIIVVNLKL